MHIYEKCGIDSIFCEIQSKNQISLKSTQIIEIVVESELIELNDFSFHFACD